MIQWKMLLTVCRKHLASTPIKCRIQQGDNDPEPSRGVPRGDAAFGRKSGSKHPACAMGGAQPPVSTTGATNPALHLRQSWAAAQLSEGGFRTSYEPV